MTLAQLVDRLLAINETLPLGVQITGNPDELSPDDLSTLRDRTVTELIIVLADA